MITWIVVEFSVIPVLSSHNCIQRLRVSKVGLALFPKNSPSPGFWFSNGFLVGSLRDPELNLTLGRSIMTDRLIGRSFSHLQSVLHDVSRLVMRWDMNLPITRPQRTQSDSGWRLATVGGNHWDLVFWDIFFEISIFFMKKMAPKRV